MNLPFDWQLFTLPGRHFRWRIRGNPLSWIEQLPSPAPDAIVATSMVDLATLRGIRRDLCQTPALLYFHENQFAYPVSPEQHRSIDPQMVQIYAALSADRVLFNSAWNRDSFLQGLERLCHRFPDHKPVGLQNHLAARSRILAVPVKAVPTGDRIPGLILWNHRWDYDKAPDRFADAIEQLVRSGADFSLALLGPRPAQTPQALARIRQLAGRHILVDEMVNRETYRNWLQKAEIVVSTAVHEFQGLAVMEAVSAGAAPLVPDALCYTEQYPASYRYPPGDAAGLTSRLRQWLQQAPEPPDISPFLENNLLPPWQAEITQLLHSDA